MELGGYRIESEIARGGQGVVYVALDPRSGRRVALKVLLQLSAGMQGRFEREAEILARLRHPNVVAVHGAGTSQGRPYLVLELVEGTSLERALTERGAFEPREAARIVRDLARGVGQAHALGLVHRDIKPANALLRPDGTVLLTDFGLARDQAVSSELSKTGVFMGTPGFASPEQAAGEGKRVGPASDVYGLGALLFALLCDRPPVEGSLLEVVIATISEAPPAPRSLVPGLDPGLDAICLRCLAKAPEERFASGDALADELERFLAGETISGLPRRSAAPWAFAGVGLLSALALGAALAWERPGPRLAPGQEARQEAGLEPGRGSSPGLASRSTPRESAAPSSSPSPARPDPALSGTLRLVKGKTRAEELDGAIELLAEALNLAPHASNRRPSLVYLADLYTRRAEKVIQRDPSQVSTDLRRAERLDPSAARRATLSEALLREALLTNNEPADKDSWPRARALLREAHLLAPEDPRPLQALGGQGRVRKDWEASIEGFEGAFRLDPSSGNSLAGIGTGLMYLGRIREGVARLEAFQKGRSRHNVKAVLGDLERARFCWGKARRVLEVIPPRSDHYTRARIGLAWIALEEGRPTQALAFAAEMRGREFDRAMISGVAALALGNGERAIAALNGVQGMKTPEPRLAGAYLNALRWEGKAEEAGRYLATLKEEARLSRGQLLFLEAEHLAGMEKHQAAGETFQVLWAELRRVKDPLTARRFSDHFMRWGSYHRPEVAYKLALLAASSREDDEDAGAWILAARAERQRSRPEEARKLLARAEAVHETRRDLHYELASLGLQLRDWGGAIKAARRALELEPAAVYAAVVGAAACIGAGRYEDARPFLEVCLSGLPGKGVPLSLRAIVAIETGDVASAVEDVKRANQLAPRGVRERLAKSALLVSQGGAERLAEAQGVLEELSQRSQSPWVMDYAKLLQARIKRARQ